MWTRYVITRAERGWCWLVLDEQTKRVLAAGHGEASRRAALRAAQSAKLAA